MRIDGRGTPDCSSSVVSNCNRRREKIVTVGGGCEVKRSSSKSMFRHYDVTRERREEPNQRRIKRYITSVRNFFKTYTLKILLYKFFNMMPSYILCIQSVPLNTIENTTSFCHNHLFKSEAFKLCGEVPNVKTDDAVQTCALDITVSISNRPILTYMYNHLDFNSTCTFQIQFSNHCYKLIMSSLEWIQIC